MQRFRMAGGYWKTVVIVKHRAGWRCPSLTRGQTTCKLWPCPRTCILHYIFRLPIRANACIYLHPLFPRFCSPSRECLSLPDANDITCISESDNTTRPHENLFIITNIDDTLLHIYNDYTAIPPQSRHAKRKSSTFPPTQQTELLSFVPVPSLPL
jgi:hypothetical protein